MEVFCFFFLCSATMACIWYACCVRRKPKSSSLFSCEDSNFTIFLLFVSIWRRVLVLDSLTTFFITIRLSIFWPQGSGEVILSIDFGGFLFHSILQPQAFWSHLLQFVLQLLGL